MLDGAKNGENKTPRQASQPLAEPLDDEIPF
jgi:hypothetical protein